MNRHDRTARVVAVSLYPLLRPLAFALDGEIAHRATIATLKAAPKRRPPRFDPVLTTSVAGIGFPSPIGLAAGFDKNAEVTEAMLGLGFGFVEVGTLTPRAQQGNPRPRLFRLVQDQAIINRLGFNNKGQDDALVRLQRRKRELGIVGVNVGANKDSGDRIADYVAGVTSMAPVADYLTINISSPNTPGLRGLQSSGELEELLAAVRSARLVGGPPLFLKVAPDLARGDHERIARASIDHGVDALIIANTTVSRPPLHSPRAGEEGGLSGRPLAALALEQLVRFRSVTKGALPLISAGGVASAEDAWQRIRAGASLVQLYSAMVFQGPGIARQITSGLARKVREAGLSSITDAVGR